MNLKNTLNTIKHATPAELFQMAVHVTGKTLLGLIVIVALTNEAWAGNYYQPPGHGNGTNRANADAFAVSESRSQADAFAIAETDVRVDQSTFVSTDINSTHTSNVGLTNNVDVAGDTNNFAGDTHNIQVDGTTVEGSTITNTVEGTTVEGSTVTGGAQSQALDLNIEGDNHYNFQMGENQYEQLGGYKRSLTTMNVHAVGNDDDYMLGIGVSFALGGSDTDDMASLYRQQVKNQRDADIMQQCKAMAVSGLEYRDPTEQYADTYQTVGDMAAYCKRTFKFTDIEQVRRMEEVNYLKAQVAQLRAEARNYDEKSHTTHLKRHGLQRQNAKDCKAKGVSKSTCHTITAAHYGKAE